MLPCELSRKMALQIVELRDVQGLTFREIALWYWNRWNKTRGEERKLYSMISHRPRKSSDIQGSLSVPAIRYLYLGHKTGWPVTGIKRYVAQHGRSGVRNHPIVSDSGDEALNRITAKSADAWRERRQHLIQAASKRKTKHFTPKPSQTMDELERAG